MILAIVAALSFQRAMLSYRWVYLQTNFFRPEEVEKAITLVRRAAKAGYNGLVFADSKLQNQSPFPDFYRRNVKRVQEEARKVGVEVYPCVLPVGYADSMLFHDPSLVEALPCRDVKFTVHAGRLEPASEELYQNGDFEYATGDRFAGFAFQDGIGKISFRDTAVKHSGQASLRIENPGTNGESSGNARVMQSLAVQPYHSYLLKAWIKSEAFDHASSVNALSLSPQGKSLAFAELQVKATQDWQPIQVSFNSQDNREARVYLGVWGGGKGKLWIDDVSVTDAGLLNAVRRPGCPASIKGLDGTIYVEGQDIERIEDPLAGRTPWPGSYELDHVAPRPKLLPGSRLKEGQEVSLSYYAPVLTLQNQVAICLSEPKTYESMNGEISRVAELLHPAGFFLSHDEIRVINQCAACRARNLSPGQLLADNLRRSVAMIKKVSPNAETFVWSDMFDPSHNAVDDYYMANGSVKGSWEGLPKQTVVVNWNSGKQTESLKFFVGRGNRQVLAGYYDGSPDSIKAWLHEARNVKGVVGVMYTTWQSRYDDLESFAKAAWGAR